MTNADLVAQIVKLATDSKKRSTSKVIDGWQDQIIALAKQVQPEAVVVPPVVVPPGPVVAGLTVMPTSGTVEVGAAITFQAQGWVAGQSVPVTPLVTWSSTGGHISTSGTYTAGTVPGTYQVTAKLVGGPQEETVPIVVMGKLPSTNPPTPGANPTSVATKLAMSTQPSGARDSTLMDTQPAVRLLDADGASVLQAGVTVTVSKASGSGTLSGTLTSVTDASGVATFTNLKITGTGAHTLVFTAPGLTSVTSASFTVSAAASGTNRPAGLTTITDQPWNAVPPYFSTSDEYGWGYWQGVGNLSIVTDALAPESPSNVLRITWPQGSEGGGGPVGLARTINQSYRTIYHCFWMKVASGFTNNGNVGTKFGFTQGPYAGTPDYSHYYIMLFNGTDDSGAMGVDLEGVQNLNRNTRTAFKWSEYLDEWHQIEVLTIANTQGASDGTIKVWIDGSLDYQYTDVKFFPDNVAPLGWKDFTITGTYGGGLNPVPHNMYVYLDHYFIGGK